MRDAHLKTTSIAHQNEIFANYCEIFKHKREIDLQKREIDLQKREIDLQKREIDLQKREIILTNFVRCGIIMLTYRAWRFHVKNPPLRL